jgi:hypothetical protein
MSNLVVPLGDGETPASFTSRLAARNGVNAREFCLDWETRFQAVVRGDRDAIGAIAEFAGITASRLAAWSFDRQGPQDFEHRGERLTRSSLRCSKIYICPACLQGDIRANPKLAPRLAVYHRAPWMLDAIKTCLIHKLALVQIADHADRHTSYDFALLVRPKIDDLDRLRAQAPHQRPSGLESYITRRLEGAQQSPFLDHLELFAAIKTCAMVGAVNLFGRSIGAKDLDDANWHNAGARGYAIVSGGPGAIEEFLDELHATADFSRSGLEGPAAIYGRLYQWLASGSRDPAYNPVRDIVGRHIRAHLPLAAGQIVFGKPLEKRVLHSIRSLSVEAHLHPKRLRRVLISSGIISEHQRALPDQHVVFAAEAASSLVEKAKGALSLPEVAEHLNAPRVQAALLAKNGFIKPHVEAGAAGALDRFAMADLDDFLRRLLADSARVVNPKPSQASIPVAAKAACCSAAEIIRLVLGKKLSWTGYLSGTQGYLSLLVDINEIKLRVRGAEPGGLSLRKVASLLETHDRAVRALINNGHLDSFMAINPVNRCPQTVVKPEEVARFQKTYISLYQLARDRGQHIKTTKTETMAAGIKPAFNALKIGATFYLRKNCVS